MSGDATLDPVQDNPPTPILRHLQRRLRELDTIGPTCKTPSLLSRFEENVLEGGRRRAIIGGREVSWYQGFRDTKAEFVLQLAFGDVTIPDLVRQLSECRLRRLRNTGTEFFRAPDEEKLRDRGLYVLSPGASRDLKPFFAPGVPLPKYYNVGEAWLDFLEQLDRFDTFLQAQFTACLSTGRILVVDTSHGSAALITPQQWASGQVTKRTATGAYYVFSGDLPRRWFETSGPSKGDVRAELVNTLAVWLEERYELFHKAGKRFSKEQFFRVAPKLPFVDGQVSRRILDDAWSKARIDWPSGRPGRGSELSDEDLLGN